jgi:hypothetical protein
MRDLNTPVWQLTAGELIGFISDCMRPQQEQRPENSTLDDGYGYVYGISGIAELLRCSKTMIHAYRKQGWIEPAIKQRGRKIVCDAPLALELFSKRTDKRNRRITTNK